METKLKKLFNLISNYRGVIRFNEPMTEHTSLGLGGAADVYAVPEDLDSLRFLVKMAYDNAIPLFPIGHGTNLLVKDGGIRGIVLSMKSFNSLEVLNTQEKETVYLTVGSGVPLGRLIQFTVQQGYAGLEGLAGIPGTIGGCVFINAGSFGAEIGDCVVSVDILKKDGLRQTLDAQDLNFSYRSSCLPEGSIIIEASFRFKKDKSNRVKGRVKEILERKKNTQPLGLPSAGCVFKNTDGQAAGRFLDMAGCKGMRIGGAEISTVHANFIINRGDRAEDFLALMERAQERVKMLFGVELKPEIQIMGEDRVRVSD